MNLKSESLSNHLSLGSEKLFFIQILHPQKSMVLIDNLNCSPKSGFFPFFKPSLITSALKHCLLRIACLIVYHQSGRIGLSDYRIALDFAFCTNDLLDLYRKAYNILKLDYLLVRMST